MRALFQFHHELNPKLWQDRRLNPVIRLKLFQSAVAFYQFLEVPRLVVSDIILTGSNASYNYTSMSDIDVHLIVDVAHSTCPEMAENLFLTKKALWAETYDVVIDDMPVELYVEDSAEPVKANGVFSILHNVWRKTPSPTKPETNDHAVRHKYAAWANIIADLLASEPSLDDIDRVLARLRTLRQNGLQDGGEFATENLAWKALRDDGLLQRLYDQKIAIRNHHLSL